MTEKDRGEQKPLVDDLIETAVSKFKAQETFIYLDREQPYALWTAAEEALAEVMQTRGKKPRDVLIELTDKTSVIPDELEGWDFTGGEKSFDKLWQTISELIIWRTIKTQFPDLAAEEKRRFQQFSSSGAIIIPFPRNPAG